MSRTDMPSMRSRSMMKTSCVEPGQIATRRPRRSLRLSMAPSLRATTAMPLLQTEPTTISGSCAAAPRIDAAMPKVPKSTDLVTTALLPSVGLSKAMTSTRMPSGTNFS